MPPSLLEVSLGGVGVAPPSVSLAPPPLALVNVAACVEDDALALPHPGDPLTLKIGKKEIICDQIIFWQNMFICILKNSCISFYK